MRKYICKEVQTENGGYLEIEKELIRCKDCRYHDGRNRCEMWDMHKTDANDFCSSAERELET